MAEQVSHCPNCFAEYRWGVSVCTECGTQVVPGPSPAMDEDWIEEPEPEPVQVEVVRLPAQDPAPAPAGGDEPDDLYAQEEHPVRVILCRIDEDDAAGVVDALDEEGIGARVGTIFPDGTAQVIVHDTRLGEAQAVMVDYMGDPSLVDGVAFEDLEPPDAQDPGRDGFVEVSSGAMSAVSLQAQRLTDEGIRARLVLPPEGAEPKSTAGWASVYVSREDLVEARHILGMEV
jgi:hypothetical protein